MKNNKKRDKRILGLLIMVVFLSSCSLKKSELKTSDNDTNNVITEDKSLEADQNSDTDEEFLNSGQAKAILDESDLWQPYEESDAGVSLRYPQGVELGGTREGMSLMIDATNIEDLDSTMGFDKATALDNSKSLSNGEYGEKVDWPLEASEQVVQISAVNAQEYMVLSRFEVCDTTFERTVYFFNNDKQVTITLIANKDILREENPDFFITDTVNCGSELIWDFDKQASFYDMLKNGDGPTIAQEWFDAFDGIVETIQLASSTSENIF